MGREIIIQSRAFNKKKSCYEILTDQYVCGRDDATEYIANLCINAWRDTEEPEEYNSHDSSPDWNSFGSLVYKKPNQAQLDISVKSVVIIDK